MKKEKNSWAGLSKNARLLPLFTMLLFSGNAWSVKTNTLENLTSKSSEAIQTEAAQNRSETPAPKDTTQDQEKPFVQVEQLPQYPGGEQALMNYLSENVHYPEYASELGIQGRVILRFVITKTGDVSNVEIIRGLDPSCDAEAMRVVRLMPKWTPGRHNGRIVPVYFVLPILYKLSENEGKAAPKAVFILDGTEPDTIKGGIKTEQYPQFKGGQEAFDKFLQENLKSQGVDGKVIVRFVVAVDGAISKPEVMKGLDVSSDKEALRVIQKMPNWEPGIYNQRKVPTFMTLPITFKAK